MSELSDEEFFKILKAKEPGKSWTIGEIYELERRGMGLLDRDVDLKKEIEVIQNRHFETVKKASENLRNQLLPFQNALMSSQSLIDRMNSSLGLTKSSINFYTGPKVIYPKAIQGLTGPIAPEVSGLQINDAGADEALIGATLERIFEPIAADIKSIRWQARRDMVFWIIAGCTFVSAIATIWMLVLTIQNQK